MSETKKGYWVAHVEVTDDAQYAAYRDAAPAVFESFGGKYLVRGGAATPFEAPIAAFRHVVIEFPSYQAALDCYNSPAYTAARAKRETAGVAHIVILEGL